MSSPSQLPIEYEFDYASFNKENVSVVKKSRKKKMKLQKKIFVYLNNEAKLKLLEGVIRYYVDQQDLDDPKKSLKLRKKLFDICLLKLPSYQELDSYIV